MAKMINPGSQSQGDQHYNPHGIVKGSAPHAGMGRSNAGTFNGGGGGAHMAPGGDESHGNQMISKFKKGGSTGGGSNNTQPISKPYDSDGDDWL